MLHVVLPSIPVVVVVFFFNNLYDLTTLYLIKYFLNTTVPNTESYYTLDLHYLPIVFLIILPSVKYKLNKS